MNENACRCKHKDSDDQPDCCCYTNKPEMLMDNFEFKGPGIPPLGRPLAAKIGRLDIVEQPSTSQNRWFQMNNKRWAITDFEVERVLGLGSVGKVYLVREKGSQYVVALKVFPKSQVSNSALENELHHEVNIHGNLHHPNILCMYGVFTDEMKLYTIMEYAENGDMYKMLRECGCFDEITAADYISNLTKALIYCHSLNIVHKNLKVDNLLLGSNLQLKITDFGKSSSLTSPKVQDGAPDISGKNSGNNFTYYHIDIWSVGVICYELLVGLPPFETKDYCTFMEKRFIIVKYPDYISVKAENFISKLLVNNLEKSLSLKEILQHPWIVDNTTDDDEDKD